uniref:Uncharacterized protein n=1 Tax=Salix viminalis TaxID=40686 RepID=A0A6N2LIK0_SALVM
MFTCTCSWTIIYINWLILFYQYARVDSPKIPISLSLSLFYDPNESASVYTFEFITELANSDLQLLSE